MKKEEYLTKEWKDRRLEILKLDKFKCVNCGATKNLQVHHKKYDNKLKVWEYPDEYLVTVCEKCHNKFHYYTPIAKMFTTIKKEKKTDICNICHKIEKKRKLYGD